MSLNTNNIPYPIVMEPVTPQNGWYLILYNNTLCIRKNNTPYYYSTNSVYHFNSRPMLEYTPNLLYIGEYKPIMMDSNYFASLPLNINDNLFFVNQMTRVVYIKPKDLVIIIPQTMPYDFKLYENFTFAGNYNPYLNSVATSNKKFSDMIPKTVYHNTPRVDTSEKHHVEPIENTLTENPYPKNNPNKISNVQKQPFHIPAPNSSIITFIIPFLTNFTTNTDRLFNTIESIMAKVVYSKIFLVTNNSNLQLPDNVSKLVTIVPYAKYVGRLGYENKLNIKMENGYDVASFYNSLIDNLVKTQLYTIWNYNWCIEGWNDTIVSTRCFSIPNYYICSEEVYKSNKYGRIGYILSGKMKYTTSPDGYDIIINGIGVNKMDNMVKIRGNYDNTDYLDRKCIMLYGNEIEVKTFFDNMKNNLSHVDFVQKII